jgi:hypothetical protein
MMLGDVDTPKPYRTRQKCNQADRSWMSESPPLADILHQTTDLVWTRSSAEELRTNGP